MLVFAKALPRIRARVEADLKRRGLPRERVLAAIVRLMEMTLVRVGNTEYAKANKSFGLTTLRNRHVAIEGGRIDIDFRGKSGIQHHTRDQRPRLARIVKRLPDLPGQELFQYLDDDGERHAVDSDDVNDYLREITGEEITAKDFRTWAATNLAALALREFEQFDSEAAAKKNDRATPSRRSRSMLGNTPAICRKCYIHPGDSRRLSRRFAERLAQGAGRGATLRQSRRHEARGGRRHRLPAQPSCGGRGRCSSTGSATFSLTLPLPSDSTLLVAMSRWPSVIQVSPLRPTPVIVMPKTSA